MVISRVRIVVWIVVVFVVIAVMVGYSVSLMMRLMKGSIMVFSPVVEPPFFKLHLLCV